jgi:hypothetical protein
MPRNVLIEFRRDTAAAWTGANPTLAAGEPGFETDTGLLKIGDGSTDWNSLGYVSAAGVTDLDGITGAVTLVAGTGVTIVDNSPSGGDITINAPGGGAGVSDVDGISGSVTLIAGTGVTITDDSPSPGDITIAAPGGGGGIGSTELIYRYTVSGSDKTSIDTGADTPDAGSNDWTNGDLLEVWLAARTDDATGTGVVTVTVNNDGGSNYDRQLIRGTQTTASASLTNAAAGWATTVHGSGGTASYPGIVTLAIPDFEGTTFNKVGELLSGILDATGGNNDIRSHAIGWRNTAAIDRLAVSAGAGQKLKVGSQLLIYKRLAS